MSRVLLLDAAWRIDRIITDEYACELLVGGRAVGASEEIAGVFRSPSIRVDVPAVIARVGTPIGSRMRVSPGCTRRRVLDRDEHLCQWVVDGRACPSAADSIEHLLPASRGGRVTWLNTVGACRAHNSYKRDRTREEMHRQYGWVLRREPFVPTREAVLLARERILPEAWKPFVVVSKIH